MFLFLKKPSSAAIRGATADAALMALLVLGIALAVWLCAGVALQRVVTHAAIMLMAVAALQIFSGNTRIVSFAPAAFMSLGAYVVGILTLSPALQAATLRQLPAFMAGHELSLLSALAVAAALGLIAGITSGTLLLRLSGSAASIATLALLMIVYTVLAAARDITRGSQPFYGVPREVGLWVAAFAAAAAVILARLFREMPWGLAARAAADDERGAAAAGVNSRRAFFVPWVLSAVIATLAGGLLAQVLGAFTPHTFYFELAFTLLAMLIVGGMGSSLGAVVGVSAMTALIELVRPLESVGEAFSVELPNLFGLTQAALAIAMVLIIWRRPEGWCSGAELHLLRKRLSTGRAVSPPEAVGRERARRIRLTGVTRHYAGIVAVEDVSLEILPNSITGLIGPNGAGKTTLINMICGEVAPSGGRIELDAGRVVLGSPHVAALAGLGRTFQNIRIFTRMTALENVLVAARQTQPTLAAAERLAWNELTRFQLQAHAHQLAGRLPYGLRRQLEIARALALDPVFLFLDEPAAGMNPAETNELMARLARLRAERSLGIVLIEHDLSLVMRLCERIVVLDRGRLIADGAPAEVQAHPEVIRAYLGSGAAAQVLRGAARPLPSSVDRTEGGISHA